MLAFALPATAWGEYRVGPGDVLELSVVQEPKLAGKHTVDEDGTIEMELLGEVAVAGKSPEEIDDLLTAKLKAFFKSPSVRVGVAEYHSQKVYVLGAVAKQGSYVIDGELTLLDAILEAGGTTTAAVGKVQLLRADTRVASATPEVDGQTIDLDKLLSGGPAGPANLKLANGDMVVVHGSEALSAGGGVVDAAGTGVTVVGEVAHPGVFRLESGATALAAVLAAGGLTKYAAPGRARVVRVTKLGKRHILPLELDDVMKKGDKSKDVVLEAGDMVIVPARLF